MSSAFGTIVLYSVNPDSVVVAADSRVSSLERDGKVTNVNDHACKITVLDANTFFFAWGIAGAANKQGKTVWTADGLAKTAALDSTGPTNNVFRLRWTVATWTDLVIGALEKASIIPSTDVGEGFFGSIIQDKIRVYRTSLYYRPGNLPGESPLFSATFALEPRTMPGINAVGDSTAKGLVGEILTNQTERAKAINVSISALPDVAQRMRKIIETVTDWMLDKRIVGGPVDVLILGTC